MQQAYRIAMISLLALMQLFAPLVHAHAGAVQFSGTVHLPGLEFLAKQEGNVAQNFSQTGGVDIIVGLAPGFEDRHSLATPSTDLEWGLPPDFSVKARAPALQHHFLQSIPDYRPKSVRLRPSPRAPPGFIG